MEWGWCRDLQSFIFVFRSHNRFLLPINLCPIFLVKMVGRLVLMVPIFILLHRIVLERPEYGYATYFFEVVQSLSIEWQIRRLVIAMKLSGCGRTALIENRPLLVRLLASVCIFFFQRKNWLQARQLPSSWGLLCDLTGNYVLTNNK